MKKQRLIGIGTSIILWCGAIAGINCGHKQNYVDQPIRLGYLPITADVSLFVALEKGLFQKEGVKVEAIRFINANDAMNPILTKKTDGAVMIGYSTLFTIFARDDSVFRIVQSGAETKNKFTSRILVPINSPITKMEDLQDKSIGTYSGITQRLNLDLILEKVFEKRQPAVRVDQVESNLQVPSLAAGQFDALFTIDPYATVAIKKGVARSICDGPRAEFIVNPFPTCATVFSMSLIKNRPTQARKVLKALTDGLDWAENHHDSASAIVAKYTDVDPEIALACGTYLWWKSGGENIDAIKTLAEIMYKRGILERPVKVERMFADVNNMLFR